MWSEPAKLWTYIRHGVWTNKHQASYRHGKIQRIANLQCRLCYIRGWRENWVISIRRWDIRPATAMLWLWHRLVFISPGNNFSCGLVFWNNSIFIELLSVGSTGTGRPRRLCSCCSYLHSWSYHHSFSHAFEALMYSIHGIDCSCLSQHNWHNLLLSGKSMHVHLGDARTKMTHAVSWCICRSLIKKSFVFVFFQKRYFLCILELLLFDLISTIKVCTCVSH